MNNQATEQGTRRRTRADALRNRDQILHATVDLIIEHGSNVPMEVIAKRAGVGIATLYRHFPDRSSLLQQVQLEVLSRSADEAEIALHDERDAFAALARYMHTAIDLRASAVMPLLAGKAPMDDELRTARQRGRDAIEALVSRAHREHSLRTDVSTGDIAMLIIRMSMPVPGVSPAENRELSHRHLELLLNGFLHFLAVDGLPGPTMTVTDLATPIDRD
jgi:AcrR family transcriptional regulator